MGWGQSPLHLPEHLVGSQLVLKNLFLHPYTGVGGGRGPTTKEPWAPPAGELRLPVTQVPHLALQAVPEILSRH